MMKKKIITTVLCCTVAAGLAGCGNMETSKETSTTADEAYTDSVAASAYTSEAAEEKMDMGGAADGTDGGDTREEIEYNTEEYKSITENGFLSAVNHPLSTFSSDVDTAPYSNVRRMILEGGQVEKDAVRIEEMINYFSYDYPQPKEGEPFSVTTEVVPCPWNEQTKLLSVGLQAKKLDFEQLQQSNLVFLIDVSGSMDSPDKLPLVQKSFSMLTENLKENDVVSIVTYASSDMVVLEGAKGKEQEKIMSAMENLFAQGATAGSKGIETAYAIAEKYFIEGGNNRIILATDGDLNVGMTSEGALKRLVEEKREQGILLSVMGFGTQNIKDNKMETLADNGNGNYSYIDSELEAKKVLVEEMGGTLFTVAKDVKFQVEFNPAKIKGYRLIGYENRIMNAEDFENDTKDAGEIGAGHRVTVLYEIADWDSGQEIAQTELKYQQPDAQQGEQSEELLSVSIRYKEPDQNESRLLEYPVREGSISDAMSDNLKFASAVAQFGMLLRDSSYKGSASYDGILEQLKEIPQGGGDAYKEEFRYLVSRMK